MPMRLEDGCAPRMPARSPLMRALLGDGCAGSGAARACVPWTVIRGLSAGGLCCWSCRDGQQSRPFSGAVDSRRLGRMFFSSVLRLPFPPFLQIHSYLAALARQTPASVSDCPGSEEQQRRPTEDVRWKNTMVRGPVGVVGVRVRLGGWMCRCAFVWWSLCTFPRICTHTISLASEKHFWGLCTGALGDNHSF